MNRLKEFFQRQKKLLLIILAIFILLIIAVFSVPAPKKQETKTAIPGSDLVNSAVVKKTELSSEDKSKANILIIAKNFVETYGSYSNQSNYKNIENALSLLSAAYKKEMKAALDGYRDSYTPGTEYQGVTTIVVSSTTNSFDDTSGKASITAKTQRKESTGKQSNYTLKYQDIVVDLVKEDGEWVVDNSEWK